MGHFFSSMSLFFNHFRFYGEKKQQFFFSKSQHYPLLERSPWWILQSKITIYLAVDYRMHLQFSAILAKSPARPKGSQHLLVEKEIWQNCITPPFGISLGWTSIILGCIPKHGKKFGMDPKLRPSQTPTIHPSQFFWHVPHSEPN